MKEAEYLIPLVLRPDFFQCHDLKKKMTTVIRLSSAAEER